MDQHQQNKWWRTFSAFQKSREKAFAPAIDRALKKQVKPTITALKEHGLITAISHAGFSVPIEPISIIVKNIYIDAGIVFGGKTYQMVKQQAEPKKELAVTHEVYFGENIRRVANALFDHKRLVPIGINEAMREEIINYYRLFLLSKAVVPISNTTRRMILNVLIDAQEHGSSIQDIVNKLEAPDFTRERARLIARTETGKAANFAAVLGARKTGYQTNKTWISARDFRTRRIAGGGSHEHDTFDHFSMNGVTVGLNDPFLVPRKGGGFEAMQQPHDPNGSAGNVCECRCSVGFTVLRDNAGRPLRS